MERPKAKEKLEIERNPLKGFGRSGPKQRKALKIEEEISNVPSICMK